MKSLAAYRQLCLLLRPHNIENDDDDGAVDAVHTAADDDGGSVDSLFHSDYLPNLFLL